MDVMHEVSLSSGRTVLLRGLKFKHMRIAEKIAGGSQGMRFQEELLKLLLFKIEGEEIKKPDLLDIDDILSISEAIQLLQVVASLLGNETGKEVKVQQVFGAQ